MIKEKRKYPRAKTAIIPDELFTIKINEILKKIGDIKNVSAGGLALETNSKFKVGDEIFISFRIPGKLKFIDGIGKVVRSGGSLIGVQFLRMEYGDETKLKMFVKKEKDGDMSSYISNLHKTNE